MTERDSAAKKDSLLSAGYKRVAKLLIGFAVALVLIYLMGVVVGWEETPERLRVAHIGWVAVACLSTSTSFRATQRRVTNRVSQVS